MESLQDFDFQSQYNIISKNISVGCLMEEQVNKIKIYHKARLEVFVTFSSTKTTQKICQTTLFKSTTFLNQTVDIENIKYQIQCTSKSLEEFEELLIQHYKQKQQPIDEVQLILNSFKR